MVDGGQSEGGDVQTKDMRTEINGGASAASDPANFELKHVRRHSHLLLLGIHGQGTRSGCC